MISQATDAAAFFIVHDLLSEKAQTPKKSWQKVVSYLFKYEEKKIQIFSNELSIRCSHIQYSHFLTMFCILYFTELCAVRYWSQTFIHTKRNMFSRTNRRAPIWLIWRKGGKRGGIGTLRLWKNGRGVGGRKVVREGCYFKLLQVTVSRNIIERDNKL